MRIEDCSAGYLFLCCALSSCSNAGDIDAVLNKAKAEGKIVMLELGSVGCIPCEQMKPVMQTSETYKGKLEVIFIDVRRTMRLRTGSACM